MKIIQFGLIILLGMMLTACNLFRGPQGIQGMQGEQGIQGEPGQSPIIGMVSFSLNQSGGVTFCKAFGGVGKCQIPVPKCDRGKGVEVNLAVTEKGDRTLICLNE